MNAALPKSSYKHITTASVVTPLSTTDFFPETGNAIEISPFDEFISNTDAINILYLTAPDPLNKELAALVLLGYMSAAESFLRALIRKIINIDIIAQRCVEAKHVTFGAALHHTDLLLPEALLEGISFAGKKGVESAIRDYIGIKGNFPGDVDLVLMEFEKVSQIRHCCVHRFGKLGANNAISLGLTTHSKKLEKHFAPSKNDLQDIADILRNCVKTINNFIFYSVLERRKDWSFDLRKDKSLFSRYYSLFSSQADNPPSQDLISVYNSFRADRKNL
jgi:hypothetical protein